MHNDDLRSDYSVIIRAQRAENFSVFLNSALISQRLSQPEAHPILHLYLWIIPPKKEKCPSNIRFQAFLGSSPRPLRPLIPAGIETAILLPSRAPVLLKVASLPIQFPRKPNHHLLTLASKNAQELEAVVRKQRQSFPKGLRLGNPRRTKKFLHLRTHHPTDSCLPPPLRPPLLPTGATLAAHPVRSA